jgi:hypothetical protein
MHLWQVDFDDGRATEDLVTELPASVAASAPRAPPEPLSFRPGAPAPAPAAPPSVPPARKAAAAPTPVAPEEEDEEEAMVVGLVDEKPLAPAPHVGFAEGSEGATRTPSGRLLPRQKTGTQWLAEQVGKLGGAVGGAALSSRISQALDSGTVISAEEAKASEGASMSSGLGAGEASSGPRAADLERFVGVWKAAGVEGREEFLKAMQLPWILRKVAAALPQPDNVFFRDEGGTYAYRRPRISDAQILGGSAAHALGSRLGTGCARTRRRSARRPRRSTARAAPRRRPSRGSPPR